VECPRCGIVFSKLSGAPRSSAAAATPRVAAPHREPGRPPYKLLAFGVIGALICHAFWLTNAALGTLKTLFHELGHAVVGWLLGYPAIPAFDFMFGGGITHYGQFHVSIALAIAAGFGYLGYRLRTNTTAVVIIAAIAVVWLIVVTKEWRRETVCAAAGVIFELLLAATFLYMAIANVGWRMPEIERPLGALVAFFVQFDSWIFAIRLMRDQDFLEWYGQGKGGALMNDLEVIALNLKIYLGMNTTIQSVAKMLFVFSFVPFGIAFWLASRHERVEAAVDELMAEVS
ncbi:MAG TPA: hypothetical protein VLU46_06235, partial [Thermoanaerobaculia bacterium]|nr:hypothetical protein [Thermoanaerobaculia bacterium]